MAATNLPHGPAPVAVAPEVAVQEVKEEPVIATYAQAAPVVAPVTYAQAAPAVAPVTYAQAAPVIAPVTYAQAAPVIAPVTYAQAAPVVAPAAPAQASHFHAQVYLLTMFNWFFYADKTEKVCLRVPF